MNNHTPDFQVAKMIQAAAAESIHSIYAKADRACAMYEPLQQLADCLQSAGVLFQLGNFADYSELTLLLDIETVEQDVRIDRAVQEFTEESGWTLRRSEPQELAGYDITIIVIWLVMWNPLPLDLNASDDDIRSYADKQAALFRSRAMYGMDVFKQLKLAEEQGLDDWQSRFAEQIKANNWEAITLRLQDARWWRRFLRCAIGRRLENLLRKDFNLIHRRHWLYVSAPSLQRRRQQKHRNRMMLESLQMVNELGQTFTLAELVEKSTANPAIRRAELMTRIAGFEYIARETGHIGEFITLTCPSRFHAAHHVSGSQNSKYDSSTPAEAQAYLQKVWGRIQASLQRQEIAVYGFRVAEPHHDGTPHWHGLFFMPKEHRQAFRRTVARYACRDSREELGLDYFETKAAAIEQAKLIQASQRRRAIEHGGHVSSIKSLLADMQTEAGFWAAADWRTFQQVDARVNFKAIDWRRGTAAGYIAKYIAKNIDGKNTLGDSVGIDYEADDRNVVETAELVDAWASLHGIRQFQQIGGAPVTTWRELRREGMTAGDLGQPLTTSMLRGGMDRARENAGIDKADFQFRDLRAKAATDKDESISLEAASRLLGHSSQTMTMHYIRNRKGKLVDPTK